MPISKLINGELCELTPEEIEQEKEMAAQKRQADEEARMERQLWSQGHRKLQVYFKRGEE